ncbi:PAS domain S-box protein, partial [Pseudomonas sp. BGM005]|nr:PAS domain S-box protein [Pseudomonas sp. BG5]
DVDGIVISWSKGASNLLGWTEDEMLGKTLLEIFPADKDAAGLLATELADAKVNGKGGGEGWRFRKDGSKIWAVGETTPLFANGQGLIGFVKIL